MTDKTGVKRPILAVDLGGTKIIAALVNESNKIIARKRYLTSASRGQKRVIERIFTAIDDLLHSSKLKPSQLGAISIAAAGAIDSVKGVVTSSPNLPGWKNVPLRDIVETKYKVETFIINDASAAALAEYQLGAGKGVSNLVFLTVSTGIGGGIVTDCKLYLGSSGSAGEIGHMTIDVHGPKCSCGNIGCLETLASGTAIAMEATRRLKQGEKSSIAQLVKGKLEEVVAETVCQAAREGDPLAQEIILGAATYLGIGLANIINIFNPDVIAIGGGVSKMGNLLLTPARQVAKQRAFKLPSSAVRIVRAKLDDDAGVYGAALFAKQQLEKYLRLITFR